MHRYRLRPHLHPQFVILLIFVTALGLCAGCGGFVYPPPTIPEAVQKEMFHVSDPILLLTFEPGRTKGHLIGELHQWPFPHMEGSEGGPSHNFTYVGDFTVITKSDEDGMPSGGEGTRKVYFHEEMPQLNFTDARDYATGQEVALDTISLSFAFKENHKIVAVRLISQQKSALPFTYKGRKVDPPKDRDTADTLEGEYSPDLGGYLLRSLNE
jgi:hypothetical protein